MKVRFVDLRAQNREIETRVQRELAAIHENTAYIGGPAVAAFEAEFARYLGVRRVVGVSSGTDALRLALLALGVGPGDEVITAPMTFIATAEAIVQTGARPVFVDIDADTGNISVPALVRYLETRQWSSYNGPRAIVPVHLYGSPANLCELREVAAQFQLKLVEDACQAHGARVYTGSEWVRAGTVGDAGCFSFYPGKNLGGWGEGGAVATNDDEAASAIANLRDHGRLSHYAHSALGYNARLDAIQAAVLGAKLEHLDRWNERRRTIAAYYRELLAGTELSFQAEPEGAQSCYHLFVIRSPMRDAIRDGLLASGIECGIHYPLPLHLQPACRFLGYRRGEFAASEELADTALSLPMHPHLRDDEVEYVARAVRKTVAAAG